MVKKKKEEKEEGGEIIKWRCPVEDCDKIFERVQALGGHVYQTHGMKLSEYPDYKETARVVEPSPPPIEKKKKKPSGGSPMTGDEIKRVDAIERSELKGKFRQLMRAYGSLPTEERDALIPEREIMMDGIKMLDKEKLTIDRFHDLNNQYETNLKPAIEALSGPLGKTEEPSKKKEKNDYIEIEQAHVKSLIMNYLRQIERQKPKVKRELNEQKELLILLNRKISNIEIDKRELNRIKIQLENEITPMIDVVLEERGTKYGEKDDDDWDDDDDLIMPGMSKKELKGKQRQLLAMQYERQIEEERQERREMRNRYSGSHPSSQQSGAGLVPQARIKVDPATGQVMKDESGNPMTETIYVPGSQQAGIDPTLLLVLNSIGGNRNNGNDPMIQMLMEEAKTNRALLLEMIKGGGKNDSNDKEAMYKMQLESERRSHETMLALVKSQNQKDPAVERALEESRSRELQMMNNMHQQSMNFMSRDLEDMKRMAYRDSTEELLNWKQKLETLNLVNSGAKSAEEKAVDKSAEVLTTGLNKVETGLSDIKELVKPMAEANAEIMKRSAGLKPGAGVQGQGGGAQYNVPHYNDAAAAEEYEKMLRGVDDLEEDE
jgi:uncharacterized C2H2 Zn-finger protein|tara:strand:- start:4190 stop:6004 length:1815 start_codon:yes stop_codon:yes gene_type:complete